MPYRPEQWEVKHEPARYPAPAKGAGVVATIGFDPQEVVGYVVWQGASIEFLTNVDPLGGYQGGLRQMVEEYLAEAASAGTPVGIAWVWVLRTLPLIDVRSITVEEFYTEIREQWSLDQT